MRRTYCQWLLDRRLALDALDDQFPAPISEKCFDAADVAKFMLDVLRDHMTDADLDHAAGLDEGVAEMAADHFDLYDDDDDFSIPDALHDLAVLMCDRIDGARERAYPRLPAQVVAASVPDAGDAPDAGGTPDAPMGDAAQAVA